MISALFCLLLVALCRGAELHIRDANDLIQFSSNVSAGTSYNGTTVFLDADLDFSGGLSEQFEPIGKSSSRYFQGIFDGQGYTISNLAMNSTSAYAGLFGYSNGGATIRNAVLDSSCSVVSSFSDSNNAFVGWFIGFCISNNRPCTIENNVNMASVSFIGNIVNLYLGGIIGELSVSNNDVTVRNCANYGSVTHSGTASYTQIGGIIGYSSVSSPTSKVCIQNCLNYGTIIHSGTTIGVSIIGGVLGYAYGNSIENCVSGGKITSSTVSNYIGSVVGYINSGAAITSITRCYWTGDVGNYQVKGHGSPNIDSETSLVSLNETIVDSLNDYNSSWNKWLLNTNNKTVAFKVNSDKGFNVSSQLVLLPSLAESENHTFSGWFTDSALIEKFTENEITEDIILYGLLGYVVTFNPNGGNVTLSTKVVKQNSPYGTLPNANRTGYTFTGWFTEAIGGIEVTNETKVNIMGDHTLYAHWAENNYTVTLDVNGGDALPISEFIVAYDQPYNCLPNATRAGYTFAGWFTEATGGTEVTNETTVKTANNHTLYAQWTVNNYTVTLNVNGGDAIPINEFIVTYDQPYNCLPNASRTIHTFSGWFTEENGGIEVTNETIVKTPYNHTLYAHWEVNKYTVTFKFEDGTAINYTIVPQKEGYVPIYTLKPSVMPAEDITINVKYFPVYTVTFNPAGGNVSMTSMTVVYEQEYGTLPIATRERHTFLGWFTGEEGSGYKVTEKTVCNTTFNHTLYAHWEANTCTVTFDFGNGTSLKSTFDKGDEIIYPDGATRDGYRLVGWFTDSACTVPFTGKTVTESLTLYAKFEKIQASSSDGGKGDGSFSLLTAPLFVLIALLL